MNFGDSLSQYVAQIGRFGCFHSDEKPWPFADWPTPREPQGEGAEAVRAATWTAAAAPAATAAPSAVAPAVEPAPAESGAPAASETTVESAEQDDSVAKEEKGATGPDATAEPKA
jgi:hypothetical protein